MQVTLYPAVVEAFHNHGGRQLKCYAIQEHIFVHTKPSFPNVQAVEGDGCMHFDEQRVRVTSPDTLRFHSLDSMPKANASLDAWDGWDRQVVEACAREIAARTGLTVFGFDLICPHDQQPAPYLLIDVNAFPSFKGAVGADACLRGCMKALGSSTSCRSHVSAS
jgi:Inositol 1,3,4-trisphosphate 5/6-kinase ATP-grasp domain